MNERKDPVEATRNTYNQIAQVYSEKYSDYYKANLSEIKHFTDQLPKGSKILDAGSGPGGVAQYLTSQGYKVVGIDNSIEMVRVARRDFPEVRFEEGDMRKLDFSDGLFNGVFADYSLIHLRKTDMKKALREFNRVLMGQGILYASLYEGDGELFIDEPFKPGEKTYWSFIQQDDFRNLLDEAGFELVFESRKESEADEEFLGDDLFFIAKKK